MLAAADKPSKQNTNFHGLKPYLSIRDGLRRNERKPLPNICYVLGTLIGVLALQFKNNNLHFFEITAGIIHIVQFSRSVVSDS